MTTHAPWPWKANPSHSGAPPPPKSGSSPWRVSLLFLFATSLFAGPVGSYVGYDSIFLNLKRTLQLNALQFSNIQVEVSTYNSFAYEKLHRLTQIDTELRLEQLRPTPDPTALGLRYVEIASICNATKAQTAALRENVRKVLTAPQLTILAQLEAGKNMLPSINEAQSVVLLDTEVKDTLTAFGDPPSGWRALPGTNQYLLPGCPESAQLPVDRGGVSSILDAYPNLASYLTLTRDQVGQIIDANSRYNLALAERRNEVSLIRADMAAESKSPVPDAALLGVKAARLEQVCRESIALRNQSQESLPGLLTDAQRARWQDLIKAAQLLPVLSEALSLNLAGPPPVTIPLPYPPTGAPPRGPLEYTIFSKANSAGLPGCEFAYLPIQ